VEAQTLELLRNLLIAILVVAVLLIALLRMLFEVEQGTVAVITLFGRFLRVAGPGLNLKLPWERVYRVLSLQHRAQEVQAQALTADQATVHFKVLVLYSVADGRPETVRRAAFSFARPEEFDLALQRSIEGAVRSFLAARRQAEVLGVQQELAAAIRGHLDEQIGAWGYRVHDVQINDLTFDPEILQSMARVVAAANLRQAAENEGQALLIRRTREAEAEGAAMRIAAEHEREAARLRGEGLALFR